jgi:hypothetical protein
MEIGIVSEGYTDQIVIENILRGFLNDKNLSANYLQPPNRIVPAGWNNLLKYCSSVEFKQSFQNNDFIIVQIDTDFMGGKDVPKEDIIETKDVAVSELVENFKALLIKKIGNEFYENYANQIIFAISVDSIECWLLPIYFENDFKSKTKTENCLNTLNKILPAREGFSIDKKEAKYYTIMSKHFLKNKNLQEYITVQPSFKLFFEELERKIKIL